jgi:hypothetical protein
VDDIQTQQNQTSQPNSNGGSPAPDWRAGIDPELAKDPSLANFKSPADLAKSFVETKRMVGNSVRIPAADAKPEEWAKFYEKVGRPESPEKYELKAPELPEGVELNEKLLTDFKGVAHKVGISTAQAQQLFDWYTATQLGQSNDQLEAVGQMIEATKAALEQEWGNRYEPNMAAAKNAVIHLGGQELMDALDRTGAGNDPVIIRAFAKFGSNLKTAGLIKGDPASSEGDAESAESEIRAILANPEHPKNPRNPNLYGKAIDEAVEYMSRLYARKNQGK